MVESKQSKTLSSIQQSVEEICKFGPRRVGSPEEEHAALWLENGLKESGFGVTMQRFEAPKSMGMIVLVHLLLALLASCLLPFYPELSLLILLVTLHSFIGEFTGRWQVLRGLVPTIHSSNVVGHYKPERPKRTIIVSAHLDTAQAGWLFSPALTRLVSRENGQFTVGPLFAPFLAMLVLALVALILSFDGESDLLTILHWLSGFVILIAAGLMAQWSFAPAVTGANDNASGIAGVLWLAQQVGKKLPNDTEFYFVGFGGEESHLSGSLAFIKATQNRLNRNHTYMINLDGIAAGKLGFVTHEAILVPQAYPDQELVVLARNLVRNNGPFSEIAATRIQGHTDALPFALYGIKALSLVALENNGIPLNYHTEKDRPELMTWQDTELALEFSQALIAAIRV